LAVSNRADSTAEIPSTNGNQDYRNPEKHKRQPANPEGRTWRRPFPSCSKALVDDSVFARPHVLRYVIWMVMREVLILIRAGITIGMLLALALSGLVRSQLYDLEPHDPLTPIASTSVLTLVACLAGFFPALRASRIDPMNALRHE
jgi:FtsX-like permease family protein